jgi:hypothetical protein
MPGWGKLIAMRVSAPGSFSSKVHWRFVIDPKQDMIAIFIGQLRPTGELNLDSKTIRLAYQAIKD